jgi:hypothetical protein
MRTADSLYSTTPGERSSGTKLFCSRKTFSYMIRKLYSTVALLLFCSFIVVKAIPANEPRMNADSQQELEPPAIDPYPVTTNQTDIGIYLHNFNEAGLMELYRSTNSTTGFVFLGAFKTFSKQYTDYDLKPRTTYYYRARVLLNGVYSDYAYITMETASKYFNPDFSAAANEDGTVTLSFTDRTYQEEAYEIMRDGEIVPFFVDGYDSGRVFTYRDTDVQPNSTYHYAVNAWLKDEGTPFIENVAGDTVTTATVPCAGAGSIDREKWINVAGRNVQYIPLNRPADEITVLSSFSAPVNDGTNYGVRVRGYVCPPMTGNYVFFIASDDESQLFLSTDGNPANKRKIAYVLDHTGPLAWSQYPSQRSAEIYLEQGHLYYIEALHKEASGGDNLAVGWQFPNGALERPIPGNRLIPFERNTNNPPLVDIVSPFPGSAYTAPADVTIQVNASDAETYVDRVEIWRGAEKLATDTEAPYTILLNDLPFGAYTVEARAYDSEGAVWSDNVNFSVRQEQSCPGAGTIQQEIWSNITGTSLSSVPFDTPPNFTNGYGQFETSQYLGSNYGSRMRAYLCVPQSGTYTFWIASDDQSQLWLSTNDQPANKRLIASVTGYTNFRDYTKYPSQQSGEIYLEAGVKYYIEALHKEGTGNDFISVGWRLPDGTLERPIAGNRLIPITTPPPGPPGITITSPQPNQNFTAPASVTFSANVTDPDGVKLVTFDIVYGNTTSRFATFTGPTSPYQAGMGGMSTGSYQLIVTATDNLNNSTSKSINFSVDITECGSAGRLVREFWRNIPGTSISSIPVDSPPDGRLELTGLFTPNYYNNDYGSRIRGYFCAPETGAYTFWISGDDTSELWVSNSDDPAAKTKVAYANGATSINQWDKYGTQMSTASINFVKGTRYYFEVLHKEANGADHVEVGWRLPSGTLERPIPGNRVIPFWDAATSAADFSTEGLFDAEERDAISVYPNPVVGGKQLSIMLPPGGPTGDLQVDIVSITGVSVQTESLTNTNEEVVLDLKESIAPGMYLVKIANSRKRWATKVQVK